MKPVEAIALCQSHEVMGYCTESACELCGCRARLALEIKRANRLREYAKRLRKQRDHYEEIAKHEATENIALLGTLEEYGNVFQTTGGTFTKQTFCTCENGLTTPGCPIHDENGEL